MGIMAIASCAVGLEVFVDGGLASFAGGNPQVADKEGYWGEKTNNIQPPWCEADYEVTPYVAEFWNSLTSCTILVWGVYGIVKHHRTVYGLELRFWAAFGALVAVGAGSVLFHVTLWRIGQVMDELPMVWGNSAFIYTCITMSDKPGSSCRPGTLLAISLATLVITVHYMNNPDDHGAFLLIYGSGVLTIVVLTMQMQKTVAGAVRGPPLMEISLCS